MDAAMAPIQADCQGEITNPLHVSLLGDEGDEKSQACAGNQCEQAGAAACNHRHDHDQKQCIHKDRL